MALEWVADPVIVEPRISYGSTVTIRAHKSVGGGQTRTTWVAISWGGESDSPEGTALFAEVETLWDTLTASGYTVLDVVSLDPNGYAIPFEIKKS